MSTISDDDVEHIRLNNGQANAIDGELLRELNEGLDRAESEARRAVIVSGYERYFSSGLNLKTLPGDRQSMSRFICEFEDTVHRLWNLPLPVVTAVNGHAIAGGCILAACGDRRIGVDSVDVKCKLGVSEVSLGIVFPAIAFEVMRSCLAETWSSRVLLGGELLSPPEANSAGILHRLVAPEQLQNEALAEALVLGEKPAQAYAHTKRSLREPATSRALSGRDHTHDLFLETWFSEEVSERRRRILEKTS